LPTRTNRAVDGVLKYHLWSIPAVGHVAAHRTLLHLVGREPVGHNVVLVDLGSFEMESLTGHRIVPVPTHGGKEEEVMNDGGWRGFSVPASDMPLNGAPEKRSTRLPTGGGKTQRSFPVVI
jgi:hypothetical protein